jgi:hypothetical protein
MSENVGASTSRNPKGLHGLYGDNFTFTLPLCYNRFLSHPFQFIHPTIFICDNEKVVNKPRFDFWFSVHDTLL